jgi:hypothetical protein
MGLGFRGRKDIREIFLTLSSFSNDVEIISYINFSFPSFEELLDDLPVENSSVGVES